MALPPIIIHTMPFVEIKFAWADNGMVAPYVWDRYVAEDKPTEFSWVVSC